MSLNKTFYPLLNRKIRPDKTEKLLTQNKLTNNAYFNGKLIIYIFTQLGPSISTYPPFQHKKVSTFKKLNVVRTTMMTL